jgi:two-component system, chemotaxis family, chemotaxis protein CheY
MTARLGSPRVLVVEDDQSARSRLVTALGTSGFQPVEAADGEEGLRKLRTEGPVSAIVLDLILPGLDGWTFRERQLRDPLLASIPTVVVSVRPLGARDLYALHVSEALQKPLDELQVLGVLERACRDDAGAPALFWSKRGVVACVMHAPAISSPEWEREGWAPLTSGSAYHRVAYVCQQCSPERSPIDRSRRKATRTAA